MKAVVLEIKNGYAAVLLEDGTVTQMKRICSVGDTIEVSEKDLAVSAGRRFMKPAVMIAAAAAVLLIIAGIGGGYYMSSTAYASIYVSAGESQIEMELNHFNRVLNINVDGDSSIADILYDEGIKNKTLKEALEISSRVLDNDERQMDISQEIDIMSDDERTYEKLSQIAAEAGFTANRVDEPPQIGQDISEGSAAQQPADSMIQEGKNSGNTDTGIPESQTSADERPDVWNAEQNQGVQPDIQPGIRDTNHQPETREPNEQPENQTPDSPNPGGQFEEGIPGSQPGYQPEGQIQNGQNEGQIQNGQPENRDPGEQPENQMTGGLNPDGQFEDRIPEGQPEYQPEGQVQGDQQPGRSEIQNPQEQPGGQITGNQFGDQMPGRQPDNQVFEGQPEGGPEK